MTKLGFIFAGFISVSSNMYVAEFAPARIRGRFISYGSAFVTGALFLAALISGIFSEDKSNGWRSVTVAFF